MVSYLVVVVWWNDGTNGLDIKVGGERESNRLAHGNVAGIGRKEGGGTGQQQLSQATDRSTHTTHTHPYSLHLYVLYTLTVSWVVTPSVPLTAVRLVVAGARPTPAADGDRTMATSAKLMSLRIMKETRKPDQERK